MAAGTKVGAAWYELSANDAKLKTALTNADRTIQQTGATAGKGFSSRFSAGLAGIKTSIGGILPLVGALGAAFVATKIVAFFGDAIGSVSTPTAAEVSGVLVAPGTGTVFARWGVVRLGGPANNDLAVGDVAVS